MALKVWLPLNKDLRSVGLSKVIAINNGATLDNNGIIGKCYNISLGKYIGLDAKNVNNHKYSPISIALWVYPTQNDSTSRSVFGCWENGGGGFYFKSQKMGFNLYIGGAYHSCEMPSTLSLNTWHHICGTYDEKVMRLYIDGVEVATTSVSGKITYHSTCPWEIGGNPGATAFATGNFAGKFNDIRIYDHCISESDVERIYNGDTKMLQVCLPLHKDCRNVGLNNVDVVSSNVTFVDDELFVKSCNFNGSNSQINTGYLNGLNCNDKSISVWVKPNGTNNSKMAFRTNGTSPGRFYLGVKNTSWNLSFGSKTWGYTSNAKFSNGQWQHIAIILKNNIGNVYFNGEFSYSITGSNFNFPSNLILSPSSYMFNGLMNDLRIYNLALTDEDVKRIYQNEEIILLPTE